MLINIKEDNSLITIDLRLKEIRDFKRFLTIPLSSNDIEGYEYLFNYGYLSTLLNCVKSDYKNYGYKISIKGLEVLKGGMCER